MTTSTTYACGQVWRSQRGHRRVILSDPAPGVDGEGHQRVWLRVAATYRDPGHSVTVEEMNAWVAKRSATLREPKLR